MINMFMSFDDIHYIQDNCGQIILEKKPTLSWEFSYIRYYNVEKVWGISGGKDQILSEQQCLELDNFIAVTRQETGILKPCIDSDGNYLGVVNIEGEDVHQQVQQSPPTSDDWVWDFDNSQWTRQYYYDNNKVYVRKSDPSSTGFTLTPKPDDDTFEYQIDIENLTWKKISSVEAIKKYKANISSILFIEYIKSLSKTEDHTKILEALKTVIKKSNSKCTIIENGLVDIQKATNMDEIEEIYDLVNMIVSSL